MGASLSYYDNWEISWKIHNIIKSSSCLNKLQQLLFIFYSFRIIYKWIMDRLKNWMIEAANIMFDDSKNDLRALPKTVRLQILIVLSFVWSTVFSLYVFNITSFIFGWAGVVVAHIGLVFAVYLTFKFFHKKQQQSVSVFESGNYNPAKIFSVAFIIFFIFIFTKGVDVLINRDSYSIPYSGPDTTTEERIEKFVK